MSENSNFAGTAQPYPEGTSGVSKSSLIETDENFKVGILQSGSKVLNKSEDSIQNAQSPFVSQNGHGDGPPPIEYTDADIPPDDNEPYYDEPFPPIDSIPSVTHNNNGQNGHTLPSLEELDAQVEASGSNELPQEDTPPTFGWLSFEETLTLPPKQWLVDNIFGAGDIGMIYGAPGSAKTFVVIDLILACCTGSKFAVTDNNEDGFDVIRPLSVAYCAGEGVAGLGQRFQAAAQRYGVTSLDNFHLSRIAPQLVDRNQPNEHIDNLIAEWKQAEKGPLDLLVIDTLHSATSICA